MRLGVLHLVSSPRLLSQLEKLELVRSGAQEKVDHPRNENDDVAASAAGAVYMLCKSMTSRAPTPGVVVQRKPHPDPFIEKERSDREAVEDCEGEMITALEETFGTLCLPIKSGRPLVLKEYIKGKVGRHPADRPI